MQYSTQQIGAYIGLSFFLTIVVILFGFFMVKIGKFCKKICYRNDVDEEIVEFLV